MFSILNLVLWFFLFYFLFHTISSSLVKNSWENGMGMGKKAELTAMASIYMFNRWCIITNIRYIIRKTTLNCTCSETFERIHMQIALTNFTYLFDMVSIRWILGNFSWPCNTFRRAQRALLSSVASYGTHIVVHMPVKRHKKIQN